MKNKPPSRQKITFSFIKILTGSDLSRRRLPVMKAVSRRRGPVVWLTGCIHGDEVGGLVVIQEIFKRLRRHPLKKGRLFTFPMMNPFGFELSSRNISIGDEDLNRSFPGNKNGSLAKRIAHTIFTGITRSNPSLVLDLHNDWRNSIPYALIDPDPGPAYKDAYGKAAEAMQLSGLLLIKEATGGEDAAVSHKTLPGSMLRTGIPALTLELGEAFVVNEENVKHGIDAVWRVLAGMEMVEPGFDSEPFSLPEEVKGRFLEYSHSPLSTSSGIIRFLVRPGDLVKEKQPVARIYNAFGKLMETVLAKSPGIVLGLSDSSVAFPGVPILAFGILKD